MDYHLSTDEGFFPKYIILIYIYIYIYYIYLYISRKKEVISLVKKCPGKGQVECYFFWFSQRGNDSRGIGDAWQTKAGS